MTTAKKRTNCLNKSWKIVLSGIVLGIVLFAVSFAGFNWVLPGQSYVGSDRNYGYEYSGKKSESVAFNTQADASDSILVFGSSELSTPQSLIPQVPEAVFGENNFGIDLTYVGEAYDQSLWHAIAVGAYASEAGQKKVVFIVSPTWFEDEGLDQDTFKLRFSYSLYRQFCDNPDISDSSKAYLAERLADFGIEQTKIEAGMHNDLVSQFNNAFYMWADDLKIRQALQEVRKGGLDQASLNAQAEVPNFEELRANAYEDAITDSTNNDWGMDDAFYSNNIAERYDRYAGSLEGERFSNDDELKDFAFLMKVCDELGLEPLVVISPVHGEFYDYVGVDSQDRQKCYEQIVDVCEARNVAVADFSDREYEKYFLHDIVHFGWLGWIDVEKAIYDFALS